MTTKEFLAQQEKRLKTAQLKFQRAVVTVHSLQANRIFGQGLSSNGAPIGQYDNSNPLYINPKNSPVKFTPQGKTGQRRFKNGNPHKTRYFNSYKGFRRQIGRKVNRVNMNLSGDLFQDYANTILPQGNKVIVGLKNLNNVKKLDGLLVKYGQLPFKLSKRELSVLTKIISN